MGTFLSLSSWTKMGRMRWDGWSQDSRMASRMAGERRLRRGREGRSCGGTTGVPGGLAGCSVVVVVVVERRENQ
jgi:hypothetical protein